MTDEARTVCDAALDTLFRKARSFGAFQPGDVSDARLHAIYHTMRHGPTTANSQSQRIVFLRSAEAKRCLAPRVLPDQSRQNARSADRSNLCLT
jgi:nitroreductase